MSENQGYEDTQWTPEARARMGSTGVELLAALSAQLEFLSTAALTTPWAEIEDRSTAVQRAAVAYADAQFDLTGNSWPFGELQEWDNNDEDGDDESEEQPGSFVSVLHRADYGVLDEQVLLEAGRLKFLENRPGQSEANAQSTVNHLGAALYELDHADGWDSLTKTAGLTPMVRLFRLWCRTKQSNCRTDPQSQMNPTEPSPCEESCSTARSTTTALDRRPNTQLREGVQRSAK